MKSQRVLWLLLAAALLSAPAHALTVNVVAGSPGVDQGLGLEGPSTVVLNLQGNAPFASGTVGFANNLALATEIVSLSLVSASPTFTGLTSGGTATVSFSNVSYSASGISAAVTPLGGGLYLVYQVGSASGTVSGSYAAVDGSSTSTGGGPFSLTVDVNSVQCVVNAAGAGTCGGTFGKTGFVLGMSGDLVEFQHTFNVTVPEPSLAMLLLAAPVAVGAVRRARRS